MQDCTSYPQTEQQTISIALTQHDLSANHPTQTTSTPVMHLMQPTSLGWGSHSMCMLSLSD